MGGPILTCNYTVEGGGGDGRVGGGEGVKQQSLFCIDVTRHRIGRIVANLRSRRTTGNIIKQGVAFTLIVHCDGSDLLRVTMVEFNDTVHTELPMPILTLTYDAASTSLLASEVHLVF